MQDLSKFGHWWMTSPYGGFQLLKLNCGTIWSLSRHCIFMSILYLDMWHVTECSSDFVLGMVKSSLNDGDKEWGVTWPKMLPNASLGPHLPPLHNSHPLPCSSCSFLLLKCGTSSSIQRVPANEGAPSFSQSLKTCEIWLPRELQNPYEKSATLYNEFVSLKGSRNQ